MYGAVPPVTVNVAVPLHCPLQSGATNVLVMVKGDPVFAIVTIICDVKHPVASVTVQVYVPGQSPVAVAFVPPLGVHKYVYGPIPPLPVIVEVPSFPPLQRTFVVALLVEVTDVSGCVSDTEVVLVHPLESVKVTL